MFLIRAGYWAIKELGWMPVYEREASTYHTRRFRNDTSGDLAFLIKLLENSNASFQSVFDVGHYLLTLDLQQENEANNENVLLESSV